MPKKLTHHRIIWAVDPFGEDTDLESKVTAALIALTGENNIPIEPIGIIHWEDRHFVDENIDSVDELEEYARHEIENLIQFSGLKQTLPPMILIQEDLSLRNAVRRLVDYAKATKADLIAVSTEAKQGSTRFLLGSFAETLIVESTLPTLVITSHTKPSKEIKRIFFPTDLSEKSKRVFPLVAQFAEEIKVPVTIFHRMPPMTSSQPFIESYQADLKRRERDLIELVNFAAEFGVEANWKMKTEGSAAVESIIEASKEPATLVAMVSQSGVIESMLLGSVTRQVIRHSGSPVWVIHPKKISNR